MEAITKIKTNVKSPEGVRSYSLGNKTLIVGDNESGKSALTEAIHLAVTGSAPNILLRNGDVKAGKDLATLMPEGEDELIATATDSNGNEAAWSMTVGSAPKHFVSPAFPRMILPLVGLRQALAGTGVTAMKYLLPYVFPEGVSFTDDVIGQLTKTAPNGDELEEYWHNTWFDGEDVVDGSEMVSFLNYLGKEKRTASANAKETKAQSRILAGASNSKGLNAAWKQLFLSLQFEWLRKMYKENIDHRAFLGAEMAKIVTPEQAKMLPNSVQCSTDVEGWLAVQQRAELAKGLNEREVKSKQKAEKLKRIEECLIEGLINAAQLAMMPYEGRVASLLPAGEMALITLTSQKLMVKLVRDRKTYRALSGSTEVRVLAALGGALATDEKVLLLLDDRMWDGATLASTMRALGESDAQTVIMSTIPPKGKLPKGWTRLDLDPRK